MRWMRAARFAVWCTLLFALLLLFPQPAPGSPAQQAAPEDRELQRAMQEAGNDRVALARNLEAYLRKFPESPHRAQVYRALAEVCLQLDDRVRAIEFAERFIALRPEDSAMMLLAAELLEEQGDAHSARRAVGYLTRILDRVEKEGGGEASPEAEAGRKQMIAAVYLVRARLEMAGKQYAEASADLDAADALVRTAEAALRRGEIAELGGDYERAIDEYAAAFVLPDPVGEAVDRAALRRKIGNVWRLRHGSEAGLGDRILGAFDRLTTGTREVAEANTEFASPYSYVLRRPDGSELRMAEYAGKVLVVHFWASWCAPCKETAALFDQAAARVGAGGDVAFVALSLDTDGDAVAEYLRRVRMRVPVALAGGMERGLGVRVLPTVLVITPEGGVAYRREGFRAEGFVEELVGAIEGSVPRP
jgi:thiol-disulfide isomerase/thioredoxin